MNIQKKSVKVIGLVWTLLLLLPCIPRAESGALNDDLLFHASFEETLTVNTAAGQAQCATPPAGQKKVQFVPGIKGKAATGGISYETAGNISPEQGTVLLWVQPLAWHPDDDGQVSFFSTGHAILDGQSASTLQLYRYNKVNPAHAAQQWIDKKLNVFAARVDDVDGKKVFRRDNKLPVDISRWQVGEWHHLAMTWSRSSAMVKLYVDGFFKGSARMPLPDAFTALFTLGDARTAFDEVRIYQRPLTLDEIRGLLLADKP